MAPLLALLHRFCFGLLVIVSVWTIGGAAQAGELDTYVVRFLKVQEPVPIVIDGQGNTRDFSAEEISEGKRLFENNCLNCHVGGSTLPDPRISLSLADLAGATPPRNHVQALVDFMREPLSYEGTEAAYLCREVPPSWLSDDQVANLAAFILRAADMAPGWGAKEF